MPCQAMYALAVPATRRRAAAPMARRVKTGCRVTQDVQARTLARA
jgi:hypothetical protein